MEPNFYAIIPANVRYDKRLKPNAKLLYGEITALCNLEGFCWADNGYFSKLYNVDKMTISRWISQLENSGYLKIEHFPESGNTRKIFIETLLTKKSIGIDKKVNTLLTKKSIGIDEKVNPIYENNTINNTMNREGNSLSFLEINYPERFERLMMQFKKQITEFVKFEQLFEATVQQEKLQYDGDVLEGRFKKFAINWIANQKQFEKPVIELNAKPAYMQKPLT